LPSHAGPGKNMCIGTTKVCTFSLQLKSETKSTNPMSKSVFITLFLLSGIFSFGQASESGYISFGDDSIFYETSGSGKVIMLIHDGMLHREVWNDQFSLYSRDYKVVRYDRRGYGKSSPATGTYTHLDDLKALYEQLRIDNAILIGCSSGGALCIDFTLENPERVNGLVLVGAVVGGLSYTGHMLNRGGHLPDHFESELEESIYYATEDPYEIYYKNTEAKNKAVEMLKNFPKRIYHRQQYIRPDLPSYRRLNEIKAPTLILVGEFDIPDVHAHAGAINAGIPGSERLIIPESGHLIPMEQPDLFNETVVDFISGIYK
jgi:3-oxoadipate enol-lactonase